MNPFFPLFTFMGFFPAILTIFIMNWNTPELNTDKTIAAMTAGLVLIFNGATIALFAMFKGKLP